MRKQMDRTGETRIMNNGMKATIIKYRRYNDIDIQFEDGTIVKHKQYCSFKKGYIFNPNYKIGETRIGETRMMNCGMRATIINYRNSHDIDIQFEDGTIVKHKQYYHFIKGYISNPNYMTAVSISCNEFIMYYYLEKYGFIKAKQGSLKDLGFGQMELDCYHPVYKIAIEYDGEIHTIKKNNDKRKNKICKQNGITIIRIREPKCPVLNDNSIEYRIDSHGRFSSSFENILKTVFQYINSITELKINENISFEQDKKYILKAFNEQYVNTYTKSRIGETNFSNKGQKMTIIKYRNSHDIDIQFEDGTIVKHKTYSDFIKGKIFNPNYRIGETRIMNNGMKATIIKYRRYKDIDIQFEDGTIVKHRTYDNFKKGTISNPIYSIGETRIRKTRIGETRMMNCGMKATIINYRKANDIDIQFEDGTIVKHKQYNNFIKGKISNPNYKKLAA